jgi:hypothetical protein
MLHPTAVCCSFQSGLNFGEAQPFDKNRLEVDAG